MQTCHSVVNYTRTIARPPRRVSVAAATAAAATTWVQLYETVAARVFRPARPRRATRPPAAESGAAAAPHRVVETLSPRYGHGIIILHTRIIRVVCLACVVRTGWSFSSFYTLVFSGFGFFFHFFSLWNVLKIKTFIFLQKSKLTLFLSVWDF